MSSTRVDIRNVVDGIRPLMEVLLFLLRTKCVCTCMHVCVCVLCILIHLQDSKPVVKFVLCTGKDNAGMLYTFNWEFYVYTFIKIKNSCHLVLHNVFDLLYSSDHHLLIFELRDCAAKLI